MLEAVMPMDRRELVMPRHTEPQAEQSIILEKLGLELPEQPPLRIRASGIELPASGSGGVW